MHPLNKGQALELKYKELNETSYKLSLSFADSELSILHDSDSGNGWSELLAS